MCKDIFIDDTTHCKNTDEMAVYFYTLHKRSTFFYKYDNQLYKCKLKDNGDLKTSNICTAFPELVDIVNKGNEKEQKNHYLFRVYSDYLQEYREILMPAKNICSNIMFKKALITIPGALFTGTQNDLDMFISATFKGYDFN